MEGEAERGEEGDEMEKGMADGMKRSARDFLKIVNQFLFLIESAPRLPRLSPTELP